MGFGAVITTGDDFSPMGDDLMQWIVEARVEQELSKETKFSIRFEDDLCEGNFEVAGNEQLRANTLIGIFVKAQDKFECLVHGPITRIRTSAMVGGTGSWVEVTGLDRRIELGRTELQASWTGFASDAATTLLEAYGFETDCEATWKEYSTGNNALNQRGSDLNFILDIARKNNLEFWFEYTVEPPLIPFAPPPENFSVTTKINLKHSPATQSTPLIALPPVLSADDGLTIKVQPPDGQCTTVTRFDTRIDFERPTAAVGFAQNVSSGEFLEQQASAEANDQLEEGSSSLIEISGVERTILTSPATDEEEQFLEKEAMLTEASWFVEVDCSSTLELLEFAATPHQIVDVKYAGERLSGPYQVMTATHVINASDHFIDFKIRANGLKEEGGA